MARAVVPHLSYHDLSQKAKAFLSEHHPSLKLPIPIIDIIEFGLKLKLISLPRLQQLGSRSFLASDAGSIYIDDFTLEKFPQSGRHILAHEVGHWVLHRQHYTGFDSVEAY